MMIDLASAARCVLQHHEHDCWGSPPEMRSRRVLTTCVAVSVTLFAACSGERVPATGSAVRDSAGVSVVTNTAAAHSGAATWQLDATPRLAIGAPAEGDVEDLAYVMAAVRLGDGRIAVANGMTSEVRFYSPAGERTATSGRAGEGPGEYRALWKLCRLDGDSLAAWDVRLRRLTMLDPRGAYVGDVRLSIPGGPADLRACTGTPRVLIAPEDRYKQRDMNRVRRDTLDLLIYDVRTGEMHTVGAFPGEQQYEMNVPPVMLLEQAPFGSFTAVAGDSARVLVADNGRGEIREFAHDGTLRRIIRTGHERVALTSADRQAYEAAHIDESWRPTYLAAKRAFLAEVRFPDHAPYFGSILLDDIGRIWVASYSSPHREGADARTWTILDSAGSVLATLETPARFVVMQAGDGWVLGVRRDEYDVEQVQLLAFTSRQQ